MGSIGSADEGGFLFWRRYLLVLFGMGALSGLTLPLMALIEPLSQDYTQAT